MRDFQKSKLYEWERKYVFPTMPKGEQSLETLTMLVEFMWKGLGLIKPPTLMINNRYKNKSTGNRYEIQFKKSMMNEYIMTHELAHSLNLAEHRDTFDWHGPNYVADYCFLLTKFYGFDINYLLFTLNEHGVKINTYLLYNNMSEMNATE